MKPSAGQTVNYVAAPDSPNGQPKIKKAKITDVISDNTVRLDHSEEGDGSHTALAHFSEDKSKSNTFHFVPAGTAAPEVSLRPKGASAPEGKDGAKS